MWNATKCSTAPPEEKMDSKILDSYRASHLIFYLYKIMEMRRWLGPVGELETDPRGNIKMNVPSKPRISLDPSCIMIILIFTCPTRDKVINDTCQQIPILQYINFSGSRERRMQVIGSRKINRFLIIR